MEVVTKIAPIALALIMLALGLGLTSQDFLRVAKQPKDFLVGLVCQLILLPIIAFLLLKIFNLPLEIALGVMIIAAAPGGCLLYTSPSPRDGLLSRMPSSA